MILLHPTPAALLVGISLLPSLASAAPTLTKIHDLFSPPVSESNPNPIPGNAQPWDTALLINDKLWYTSYAGGTNDDGSISSYDLITNFPKAEYSLQRGATGRRPVGSPTQDGDLLYYMTQSGGAGDRGVLSAYNMVTGDNTVLWAALPATGTNGSNLNPGTLQGDVAIIDRGADGKDIYFLTPNGGTGGAAAGTILRYNTISEQTVVIHNFGAAPESRQPYKGFTAVGYKLYFTTFTGGNISPTGDPSGNATDGVGTLNVLDVTHRDAEDYQQLALLDKTTGNTRFPAHNPHYRAADHSLYFGTVGTATAPGAIMKFDLTTEKMTVLHTLKDMGSGTSPRYPDGRFIYGSLSEWNRTLYYATNQGGTVNGTINSYNLDTGVHSVLFNLASTKGDNNGGMVRGGFTYNNSMFNGQPATPAFYLLTQRGGTDNTGTILRMDLDPPIPPTPYEGWAGLIPGFTGPESVPNADWDGDGIPNSSEFTFGTSPVSGENSNPATLAQSEGGLEIRWNARTDGSVSYTVTGNATLAGAWTPVTVVPAVMNAPDVTPPAGYERRHVIIPQAEANGFFRVEATFGIAAKP